jgi:radical SAM superfamily enzyme YgiQ (UPF0313 family)
MELSIVSIEPMPDVRPKRALLVGFQDQDNLGLRYLMSAAKAAGHRAEIMTYGAEPDTIFKRTQEFRPDVIGFSLIFQYMAPDFAGVIAELRKKGVTAHFTIGGHYASFEPAQVIELAVGLDSVIRFDGELTLVGLLNCLGGSGDWRELRGIAWQENGDVKIAPLAEPVPDLDTLPWPDRRSIDYESHPMPTASVLGSRGCTWDCTFCSIRPFYEEQGGKLRRLRDPRAVVDEMIELYRERGVPIFLFQDDDYLAGGRRAKRWAIEIANLIRDAGLSRKIAYKISCRSDEIDEEIIRQLMAGGLTHVYMGVESGDEQGLLNMNKHMKPETHLRAGRILKKLGLSFDFGFMLVDPYSTFDMIRNNISFLEEFIGDGWSVAPFCRMLPYAGTPIKRRLEAEGRLLGTPYEPYYHFLDPKLDLFYDWMVSTFYKRNFTNQGLCHILRGMLFEARLRLDKPNKVTQAQRLCIEQITAICNRIACYTLRSAIDYIERTPLGELEHGSSYLGGLMQFEHKEEERLTNQVMQYYAWVHQDRSPMPGPVSGRRVPGAFENSWTFATGDREASGKSAA